MKISKVKVENFRLLKKFTIDLEENLSVVIGKNNCGKTSLLLVLDKFLNNKSFSFDDFNNSFKRKLKDMLNCNGQAENKYSFMGIKLKLFIEYSEEDDLSNIGDKVIMDLDPNNNIVVLAFEYHLPEYNFDKIKSDFRELVEENEFNGENRADIFTYLKQNFKRYFVKEKKSVYFDIENQQENEQIFTDLLKEKVNINNIINFKWIDARRNVSNKDNEKNLSTQSSRIYKNMEEENSEKVIIEEFKNALLETDKRLDKIYERMFEDIIKNVRDFGGITEREYEIKITSSLQHKELLDDNTTVTYGSDTDSIQLPESHNGLGYMNLISMIFDIRIIINEFQRSTESKVADINLLFLEEPEAHTHPQMQRIFIKNIKTILNEGIPIKDQPNRNLQTVLSTHSPHIVSESDFLDIKYFKKIHQNVESKNLKDLEKEYDEATHYKFLKQYLTLHRADLFFANKAIFIEGDTERIILPAMMRKIDVEDEIKKVQEGNTQSVPLLSQNISIIEVGSYVQVFEKFINFIGVKSLIITDIDSVKEEYKRGENGEILKNKDGKNKKKKPAYPVEESTETSNESLKYFFGKVDLKDLKNKSLQQRRITKCNISDEWIVDKKGETLIAYQSEEINVDKERYYGRSFEDSFLHMNKRFINEIAHNGQGDFVSNLKVPSLQQGKLNKFVNEGISPYLMAKGVIKKPAFAMEILLNSKIKKHKCKHYLKGNDVIITDEFSNWNIPNYIKEGLQWLKED